MYPVPAILFRVLHDGGTHQAGIPFLPTPEFSPTSNITTPYSFSCASTTITATTGSGSTTSAPTNSNTTPGALTARNPNGTLDPLALDNHLSWTHFPTPFISLCTWHTAIEYLRMFQAANARNIRLAVIDTDGLEPMIRSAHAGAYQLGYHDEHPDRNRRLNNHTGEWLLCHFLPAVPRRVLAIIPASRMDNLNLEALVDEIRVRTDLNNLLSEEEMGALSEADEAEGEVVRAKVMEELAFRLGKKFAGGWRDLARQVLKAMGRREDEVQLDFEVMERVGERQAWEDKLERLMRGVGIGKGKGKGR